MTPGFTEKPNTNSADFGCNMERTAPSGRRKPFSSSPNSVSQFESDTYYNFTARQSKGSTVSTLRDATRPQIVLPQCTLARGSIQLSDATCPNCLAETLSLQRHVLYPCNELTDTLLQFFRFGLYPPVEMSKHAVVCSWLPR